MICTSYKQEIFFTFNYNTEHVKGCITRDVSRILGKEALKLINYS